MIRVLIADDHALVRGGLKQIIASTADIEVAGEATRGSEVLDKLRSGCDYQLLLLDMSMPGPAGIDLIRHLKAAQPDLPILVLSMHNEGQVVSRALRAGAAGYVTKDSEPEILLAAIRKVANGGRFLDPTLVDAMVFDTVGTDAPPHERLSDREFQVLQLLAKGHSLNEIGEMLNISAKTISSHKMRLMEKLGIDNNAALVRYAIRHHLVGQ
jgi:DNA-binding NarL/FixJ family response regulator